MAAGPDGKRRPGDVNPVHVLIFCLGVVVVVFAGSIALSIFYVQQNKADTIPP